MHCAYDGYLTTGIRYPLAVILEKRPLPRRKSGAAAAAAEASSWERGKRGHTPEPPLRAHTVPDGTVYSTAPAVFATKARNMIQDFDPIRKALAMNALSQPDRLPFKVAEVKLPDPSDRHREENRRTHRSAAASALYIRRAIGADQFGLVDYRAKADDLVCHGRQHPIARFPAHLREGDQVWEEADAAAAANPSLPAAMHIIGALPEGQAEDWQRLVTDYLFDLLVTRGMICDWAIHAARNEDRTWKISPHAHVITTTLGWRHDKRPGKRMKSWLGSADQIMAAETEWLRRTNLKPLTYTI